MQSSEKDPRGYRLREPMRALVAVSQLEDPSGAFGYAVLEDQEQCLRRYSRSDGGKG
jgi:hypothetical protein